jgi:regulator of sirC expression with transglutaminase-like and TPR domain
VSRRALALLLALAPALACSARRAPLADAPLARRLVSVPNEVGLGGGAAAEAEAARKLEALAARVRAALAGRGDTPPVDVLNRVVFDDLAFAREVEDTDLAYVLLPSVVDRRRGSCVGLGTLYLALAELSGVPVRGVVVPGHFFVRARQAERWRNVELLRRGEEETQEWYATRWPLPPTTVPVYDRPLTDDEVVGVVLYDAGKELGRRGRLAESRRVLARAVALFPSLPEAQASLGAALQLSGALEPALAAYRAASRVAPELPGLDRNLQLLQDETKARSEGRRTAGVDEQPHQADKDSHPL